jgi:hypothetical protein
MDYRDEPRFVSFHRTPLQQLDSLPQPGAVTPIFRTKHLRRGRLGGGPNLYSTRPPSGYNQTDGTLGMLRFLRIHPAYRGYQMSEAYH